MIARILPLLNKLLPTGLAFKGLQKLDPRIGKFITGSMAAGYTIDQSLDFLRNKFQKGEEGEGNNLRPDERAAKREVQNSKEIPNFLQTAAAVGGGLGAGALGMMGSGEEEQTQPAQPAGFKPPQASEPNANLLPLTGVAKPKGVPPQQPAPQQQQAQPKTFSNGTPIPQVIGNLFQNSKEAEDTIKKMISQGVDPQEIIDYFRTGFPDFVEKLEKESGRPFEMILDDYFTKGKGKKSSKNLKSDFEKQYGSKSDVDSAMLASFEKILKM